MFILPSHICGGPTVTQPILPCTPRYKRGREAFDDYLREIDSKLAGREWFTDRYSVADPYLFVFDPWGLRRGYLMDDLENFSAFKDSMLNDPRCSRF